MILGADRPSVIAHIRTLAEARRLNDKAELDDPCLSEEKKMALIADLKKHRAKYSFPANRKAANRIMQYSAKKVNRKTEYVGLEKIAGITDGAIITHNHFNQFDSTAVTSLIEKKDGKTVCTIIEETNLALPGILGFLMQNGDTIPITGNFDYMRGDFVKQMQQVLDQKDYILIYPEQEMWFNYRKPRPGKRGAYYYAAMFGKPVISLFTEMIDEEGMDDENFRNVRWRVHVLDPLYPDPNKSLRKNSIEMAKKDDEQRKAAYERIYGRPLSYDPEPNDIAGYMGPDWELEKFLAQNQDKEAEETADQPAGQPDPAILSPAFEKA